MSPAWLDAMALEAERDLVFLFAIANWAKRSAERSIKPEELPPLIAMAATALFERGCAVGFGDPDSEQWQVWPLASGAAAALGTEVSELWAADQDRFEFLAFARRPKQASLKL